MVVLFTRFLSYSSLFLLVLVSCSKDVDMHQDHTLSLEDEQKIGQYIDDALLQHFDDSPSKYALSTDAYPNIYSYLQQRVQDLYQSDYYNNFLVNHSLPNYRPIIRVLQDSGNTGAFIAPGGHIYLYTDFLRTVQTEAQFMAVLSHLIICSAYKFDLQKLERRFSRGFLFDVALGSNLSSSSAPRDNTDFHDVLEELEDHPYPIIDVSKADYDVESTLCELGYNLRSYSDLYQHSSPIKWLTIFPRTLNSSDYSTHLNYLHNNDPNCNGQTTVGNYSYLKSLLP